MELCSLIKWVQEGVTLNLNFSNALDVPDSRCLPLLQKVCNGGRHARGVSIVDSFKNLVL